MDPVAAPESAAIESTEISPVPVGPGSLPIPDPPPIPDPTRPHERESHGLKPRDRDQTSPSDRSASTESPSNKLPRTEKSLVWGIPFDRLNKAQSVDAIERLIDSRTTSYVITANLNYLMHHHRNPSLRSVTDDAAMILADGQPIVLRSRWNSQPLPTRVAGSEMIYDLAERAREKDWGIYFLGGQTGVAERCAQRLADRYPGLRIVGVESPPYRQLTEQEQLEQDARIRDSGADLLLVALGQPKGEIWIHPNYQRLGVPVSIQLGASFDFVAGIAKRAPRMWQRCGMEWAYRMLSDPRRLLPRYASNAFFLIQSILGDLRGRRSSPAKQDEPNRTS